MQETCPRTSIFFCSNALIALARSLCKCLLAVLLSPNLDDLPPRCDGRETVSCMVGSSCIMGGLVSDRFRIVNGVSTVFRACVVDRIPALHHRSVRQVALQSCLLFLHLLRDLALMVWDRVCFLQHRIHRHTSCNLTGPICYTTVFLCCVCVGLLVFVCSVAPLAQGCFGSNLCIALTFGFSERALKNQRGYLYGQGN